MNPLISAAELAAALDGPRPPLVLDARYNLVGPDGHDEFCEGHVPGARYVDLDTELAGPPGRGGRHPLPDPAVFAAAMRRVGVGGGPVVVTDGGSMLGAARLWWLLLDAGHPAVRVLDGGFLQWRTAGLPVAVGPDQPVAPTTNDWEARPGALRQTDAQHVAQLLASGGSVVDVRAPERFVGESEPIDPVAGHIPGARNAPSAELFADGRFRPAPELVEVFAERGVTPDSIVYCGSGVTACQTLLGMAAAGLPLGVLYPGSWSGWITDPARPVATGPR